MNRIASNYVLLTFWFSLGLIYGCATKQAADSKSSVFDNQKEENNIKYEVTDALFWTQSQREISFNKMKDLTHTTTIKRGDKIRELPLGTPLKINLEIDGKNLSIEDYLVSQNNIGVVILQDGKIRLEKYKNTFNSDTPWISFSVTKSLTSTLVGAAILDGYIGSIDEPITKYIPELAGSGYDGVAIRHVLTMSSGVKWNEDYSDPESDVAKMSNIKLEQGQDPTIAYMKTLVSETQPGTRWNYNTGETNLIGVLVAKATGKTLSEYLSEKIWIPYGMEHEAYWSLNAGVSEYGGCCISASIRDFARFGQFVLDEMNADTSNTLPKDWLSEAGKKQVERGVGQGGYGYQWWIYEEGGFLASGIYGQGIFIDQSRNLVIATNSNYVSAVDSKSFGARDLFYKAVQRAIDSEN